MVHLVGLPSLMSLAFQSISFALHLSTPESITLCIHLPTLHPPFPFLLAERWMGTVGYIFHNYAVEHLLFGYMQSPVEVELF